MKRRSTSGVLAGISALASLCAPINAHAEQFIGFGQAGGVPAGWTFEAFPAFVHTGPNSNEFYTSFTPAYFTGTGVTGTNRDQFEFLVNGTVGYANTHGAPDANGFGFGYPGLGMEYYYNVIVPTQPMGSPGYVTFWTNPQIGVSFPNGSSKTAGFGAGANQFSYALSFNNYAQIGKIGVTFDPIQMSYSSRDLNATDFGFGFKDKLRGGLSARFGEVAAGYLVRDDLFVGIHHAYNIYNWKSSDYPEVREGEIGPSFSYGGFAKYGLYICGNLNFDYHTSPNLKKSTSVTLAIVKFL